MNVGETLHHPTHDAADPQSVGWRAGMVYCRACGALLRSERGLGTSPRVFAPCRPVEPGFRGAAPLVAAAHG